MTPERATAELTDDVGDYACVFFHDGQPQVQLDGIFDVRELRKIIAKLKEVAKS